MTEPTRDTAAGLSRIERLTAWLSYKFGKRPSDALLDYCAEWAATPSLRREAARLLAKRSARREAALLRAGIGAGGEGQGGGTVD